MKQFAVTVLLVVGLVLNLSLGAFAQFDKCNDDEHLMDPPECPDHEEGIPTYFPYPYDCTKYFECSNGNASCIQCPVGTVWDQELTTCNHESVVPCNIHTTIRTTPTTTTPTTTTPTTTTPTTTTPTTTTPTTTTPTTTTPTTTTPTTTTPTTTTPTTTAEPTTEDPATWICPEGYEGPIGHPWTCRQFYICDPGQRPCLYDCPGDLYYNPDTMECDWQFNVPSCEGGTPPPPTTTQRSSGIVNYRTVRRFPLFDSLSFASFFKRDQEDPCAEPRYVDIYNRVVY